MSIPTRQCIVGQIASQPEWSKTNDGTARLFARIKIRARRPREDGTYGEPVESFHNLIAYVIVAAGYVRTYSYEQDGEPRTGEEFVMRWFGHEAWRTQYTVARFTPAAGPPSRHRAPRRSSVPALGTPGPAPEPAR